MGGILRSVLVLALCAAVCQAADAAAKARHAPPSAPAAPAEAAAPRPAFVVAVLGDGSAEALADALRDELAAEPAFAVVAETHGGAGLGEETHFDWTAAVASLLASWRVDAAVIMLGAGDRKALPDGTGLAEPGTPRWRTLYGDRITALLAPFRAKAIPVIWVGLPLVADEQLSAGIAARNEVARDRAAQDGASYVDSWNAFADESGRFDASGPDRDGRIVRLRSADGRSFTKAGAAKLASFVEPVLRRTRTEALTAAAEAMSIMLPSEPELDVTAEIRRDLGLPAVAALPPPSPPPSPADAATAPVILTAPPLSPEGQLVAASIGPAPVSGTAASLAQRALVEGRPIAPKPGRIDDFTWPRP